MEKSRHISVSEEAAREEQIKITPAWERFYYVVKSDPSLDIEETRIALFEVAPEIAIEIDNAKKHGHDSRKTLRVPFDDGVKAVPYIHCHRPN